MDLHKKSVSILIMSIIFILGGIILLAVINDNLFINLISVMLMLGGLLIIIINWKTIETSEQQKKEKVLSGIDYIIEGTDINYTYNQVVNLIKDKGYVRIDELSNDLIIFQKRNKYIVLDNTKNLGYALSKIYQHLNEEIGIRKSVELVTISFVDQIKPKQLDNIIGYYRRHILNINEESIASYLSEDGSGFNIKSLFIPVILSTTHLYYVENVQIISILKKLGLI